jgi:hypothetical protein
LRKVSFFLLSAPLPDIIKSISYDIFRRKFESPYCLFIGAGSSVPFIDSASRLEEDLLHDLFPSAPARKEEEELLRHTLSKIDLPSKVRLETVCEAYKYLRSYEALASFLGSRLKRSFEIPEGHRCLARLVAKGYFRIIFTTNLDELCEDALNVELHKDSYQRFVTEEDFLQPIRETKPRLYKLHRTYSSPRPDVCWDDVKQLDKNKAEHLIHFWANYNFIFVGYSANDLDIFTTLQSVDAGKREKLATFWFTKGEPSERIYDMMSKYSKMGNIIPVGDLPSGSDLFRMMENALSPLEQREEMFRMWTQADTLLSSIEQHLHDLREIVERLKKPQT